MKFDFKNLLKLLISLLLGGFIIWYIQKDLSDSDKNQIITSIRNVDLIYVFAIAVLGILACIIRGYRWKMLLKPLGYEPNVLILICSIFIMYIANLLFPRLGEVTRCTILQKQEKIPFEKSFGTMIVERLVDMIGMGIIALLGVFLEYDKFLTLFSNLFKNSQNKKEESSLLVPIIIVFLIIIGTFAFWKNPKIKNFILEKIKGIIDGLTSIFKLENPILFIIYSASIYGIYFISTYILYFAIQGTSHLTFTSTFVTLSAATLGVGLTQGGIGAFQFLVTKTLELYNVTTSIGLAYAWTSWLIQTANLVIFGILSWIYILIRPDGKR